MKKYFRWMIVLAAGASAALADVDLDFALDSAYVGAENRLSVGSGDLTFHFAIDGLGNVELDAVADSSDKAVRSAVDGWDGVVGVVTDASLFGTSFRLTLEETLSSGSRLTLDGVDGGVIGVSGQNSSRIDGFAAKGGADPEALTFSLAEGNVILRVRSWDYGVGSKNMSDAEVVNGPNSRTWVDLPGTSGSVDVSADEIEISSARKLSFQNPAGATHGYALGRISFSITPDLKATNAKTLGLLFY